MRGVELDEWLVFSFVLSLVLLAKGMVLGLFEVHMPLLGQNNGLVNVRVLCLQLSKTRRLLWTIITCSARLGRGICGWPGLGAPIWVPGCCLIVWLSFDDGIEQEFFVSDPKACPFMVK